MPSVIDTPTFTHTALIHSPTTRSIAFVLPPRQLKAQKEKRQAMVPPVHHPHDYKREGRAYLGAHPDEYRCRRGHESLP